MRKFYTGTTMENLHNIIKDGRISTTPPSRVWEDYSQDYIYMIDSEYEEGALRLAAEQSAFAIWKLNHTRRVVLEIQGIKEDLLEEDNDVGFESWRYPRNIPLENITGVFIEKRNANRLLKELIALTKFSETRPDHQELMEKYYDYGMSIKEVCSDINIPFIEYVFKECIFNEKELEKRYMDLLDWHTGEDLFTKKTLDYIIKKK